MVSYLYYIDLKGKKCDNKNVNRELSAQRRGGCMGERAKILTAEYEKDQLNEIQLGIEAGIDTSIYEDKRYLAIQMRQIRLGLAEKLPVEKYASPDYDWFQMEEIRKGLQEGVDVSVYSSRHIPYETMRQLRKALSVGINLSAYKFLKADVLRQLRHAYIEGIDLGKYIHEGYDAKQLYEIRLALKDNLDITPFLTKEYIGPSLAEIRKGLAAGVDVSLYATMEYSWRQMRELREGMESRLNISKYRSPLYSWRQMHEIRLGLEQGLDVDEYCRLRYTSREMRKKRLEKMKDFLPDKQSVNRNRVKDEDIEVEITSNDMEAYVRVLAREETLTKKRLLEILEFHGIRAGIIEGAIEQIVKGENIRKSILVAKGEIPRKGADGWYECYFRTNINKRPKIMKDGSADYKNVEWFESVKEGQKLVYYHRAEPGTDGYTVNGRIIPAQRGAEKGLLTGKGFEMLPDKKTYIATISGMVKMQDATLEVSRYMEVEDVTPATGNIRFDGNLHIKGNVENGTEVHVTEDLEIDGNVGAATIICGGNILLKKGMNAAGHGSIKAEKGIVSRFFEAVKVEANGDIHVNKCLNSQLYAGGMIISTSTIAGGVACAEKGFRITNTGNSIGLHTAIKIGYSDVMQKKIQDLNAAIWEAEQELGMLNNSYQGIVAKYPAEIRNAMELFIKLEKAVVTKQTQLADMRAEFDNIRNKLKEAKVVIGRRAFEGTVVEIDNRRWKANNQYNVIIRNDCDEIIISNN